MYKNFKEMNIWKESMEIAVDIFKISEKLPRKEDFALTSQIRRSSLSISGNIAEAFGRGHSLDKVNFYYFARGSVAETQNYIEYGKRVGYFEETQTEELNKRLDRLCNELNKIIVTLTKSKKIKEISVTALSQP